jgi:hypothetical protein
VAWTNTADALLTASPAAYQQTPAVATAYHTVSLAYVEAVAAMNDDAQKNKSLVAARDQAKKALLDFARPLYTAIQANPNVTYQAKVDMGIKVKSPPSPIPAPGVVPTLSVASVFGRQVRLNIRNPITGKRAKPAGCVGVSLYSFIGDAPPTGNQQWRPEGNVTKSEILVNFPESVEPTTVVWFCAFYYTARGLSGVTCTPIHTRIGFEGADPLAA